MTREEVQAIRVPQLDVNDLDMELLSWSVEDGASVDVGDTLCVLETAKATFELEAEHAGVFSPSVAEDTSVRVGQIIGHVGASAEAIAAHRSAEEATDTESSDRLTRVTAKARALAEEHGLDAESIPHQGGIVKEKDVRRHLDAGAGGAPAEDDRDASLPGWLAEALLDPEPLSRHRIAVGRQLTRTQSSVVAAQVETEIRLDAAAGVLDGAGPNASVFHLVLQHAARALDVFPLLKSFRVGDTVRQYRSTDIAFTVAGRDRRLFTPVLRSAAQLDLDEVVTGCADLVLRIFRDEIGKQDLIGGCFTVSMLTGLPVTRFLALQNQYQSAALAVGSPREQVVLDDAGHPARSSVSTCVLTYDHAICDGYYAGEFLAALKRSVEQKPDLA